MLSAQHMAQFAHTYSENLENLYQHKIHEITIKVFKWTNFNISGAKQQEILQKSVKHILEICWKIHKTVYLEHFYLENMIILNYIVLRELIYPQKSSEIYRT